METFRFDLPSTLNRFPILLQIKIIALENNIAFTLYRFQANTFP